MSQYRTDADPGTDDPGVVALHARACHSLCGALVLLCGALVLAGTIRYRRISSGVVEEFEAFYHDLPFSAALRALRRSPPLEKQTM